MFRKGFTLIELLIVVAIIGILVAIAIPNFLEAQARAKVSTAMADMRNLSPAIEMYKMDTEFYPSSAPWAEWSGYAADSNLAGLGALTSPISYMKSLPYDPFGAVYAMGLGWEGEWTKWYYYRDYWDPSDYWYDGGVYHGRRYRDWPGRDSYDGNDCWSMVSVGPSYTWYPVNPQPGDPVDARLVPYDSSNGTTSFGIIARWGP